MTALVRAWLLGITGTAILAALAQGLMPEGGAKRVGSLVCALGMLAAILRPLGPENVTAFSRQIRYDLMAGEEEGTQLQKEVEETMKSIIEEEMSAYSMDKAAQAGVPCRIRVYCEAQENGVFLPARAQIFGVEEEARQWLCEMLREDLGLEEEMLEFQESDGE